MASVGVAFYVAAALRTELLERGYFSEKPPPDVRHLLDLVAVGTIADGRAGCGLPHVDSS